MDHGGMSCERITQEATGAMNSRTCSTSRARVGHELHELLRTSSPRDDIFFVYIYRIVGSRVEEVQEAHVELFTRAMSNFDEQLRASADRRRVQIQKERKGKLFAMRHLQRKLNES